MPDESSTSASFGSILGLVIEVIALVIIMGMVASEITYLATLAHLQEAKMLSSALAGALTAASVAPQAGLYCVAVPGVLGYDIAVGSATLEGSGGLELPEVPDMVDSSNVNWCPYTPPAYAASGSIPCMVQNSMCLQYFRDAAAKYDIPLQVLLAVGQTSSGLRQYAGNNPANGPYRGNLGDDGGAGIMQLPVPHGDSRNPSDPSSVYNLQHNIDAGADQFNELLGYFSGDYAAAFLAYSTGSIATPGVALYKQVAAQEFISEFGGAYMWVPNLIYAPKIKVDIYNALPPYDRLKSYGNLCDHISAPQYCVSLDDYISGAAPNGLGLRWQPGSTAYTVEKKNACDVKQDVENARYFETIGLSEAKYGFVAVLRTDAMSGGVSYMPMPEMDSQVIHIPAGQRYTILAKKELVPNSIGGKGERVVIRIRKGGLVAAGCHKDTPSICLY